MATTLFLTDEDSEVSPYLRATLGARSDVPSLVRAVTTTLAGPQTIQATRTAGGTALAWITDPLAAYSPTVAAWTAHLWALESVATVNAGLRARVLRWSTGTEGTDVLYDTVTAETGTVVADVNRTTVVATAGAMAAGDRLVVKVYAADAGGTMAAGTVTLSYNGQNPYAEGDSSLVSPDTITLLAASPTAAILGVRQAIYDIGTDSTYANAFLTNALVTQALAEALTQYSRDRPRVVAATLSGDGTTYDFRLPRGWVYGLSNLQEIEYPAGNQFREIVDQNDYMFLDSVTGSQPQRFIRFTRIVPSSGTGNVVVRYTTRHVHTDQTSTVWPDDVNALYALAGSIAATMAAARMAATADPTLAADSVDYRGGADRWMAVARALRQRYTEHVSANPGAAPAGTTRHQDPVFSWGQDLLYHGRRAGPRR